MICAIDPGIRTGWAMSDGTTGTIDLKDMFERDRAHALNAYAQIIAHMLTQHQVHLLLIERPMGRLVATILPEILTARAHEVAWTLGVQRAELTVPAIRKIVCGDARADKKAVQLAVEVAGWKVKNPHEADAVAVLLAGIEKAKTERVAA